MAKKDKDDATGDAPADADAALMAGENASAEATVTQAPAPVTEAPVVLTLEQKIDHALGAIKHLASRVGLLEEIKHLFAALR